ncbi:MAG TPA: hypothetical protein VI386_38415 [Candidatus Sulfotelmatobacter sp.]
MDSTHNALIAVTNGGSRPTDALLTIHYDNGRQKYEVQQTIAAGDQMWLNLAELIRNRVPDRKGRTLPADLTEGTYELEDLNPGLGGNLIEGKVSLDKTWGHLAYGCIQCCGYSPYLSPDTLGLGVGGNGTIGAYGENNCTGVDGYNLGSYFNQPNAVWWSGNSATAAITKFNGHGVAAGSTNGFATATIPSDDGNPKVCPQTKQEGDNNVAVTSATVTLNPSGQVSPVDAASTLYKGYIGTLNLGIMAGHLGLNNGCVGGNELVGTVQPSTSVGPVTVKRTLTSEGCYQSSAAIDCPQSVGDDTGDWYTTNPQEVTPGGTAAGKVFNLDAPGITGLQTTTPVRVRFNFTAYGVGPDGQTQISPSLNYFVRISCQNNSSGVAQLGTDVSADNQIGLGTTKTSWNLQ